MNILSHLPRGMRTFLLDQPLPEGWKRHIEVSLSTGDTAPKGLPHQLGQKRNYNMVAALVILVLSGFIVFSIAN